MVAGHRQLNRLVSRPSQNGVPPKRHLSRRANGPAQGSSPPAKISAPSLIEIYPRDRLSDLLDSARRHPVIWIAAPPGCGKTTLAASYLSAKNLDAIWYRLDAGDGDIASFFYYMGLAAQGHSPAPHKPFPLLTPEFRSGLATFARNYFRQLFTRMDRPAVLVLDDYHEVPPASSMHEALPLAFDEIPEGVNVIVLSRSEPPASFARLRASGRLVTIGWEALRLTEDETAGISRLRLGPNKPPLPLDLLHKQADGWVAGLILMLERSSAPPDRCRPDAADNQSVIFDYFAREILQHTDPGIQLVLLKTALLPRISVEVAREMTESADAARILEDLARRNYFTTRHQTRSESFEYHPLFRAFLMSVAAARYTQEQVGQLLCRGAELAAAGGDVEAAMSLAQQAGDWPMAVRLVTLHARDYVAQGRLETLTGWLRGMPCGLREGHPWLLYWLGVCSLPYRPRESRAHFEAAFRLFQGGREPMPLNLAWAGIIDSIVAEGNDYLAMDPWLDLFHSLPQPSDPPQRDARAAAIFSYVGGLFHRHSDHPDLAVYAEQAEALLLESPDVDRWMIRAGGLVYYYQWTGRLAKAEYLLKRLAPRPDVPAARGQASIMWCMLKSFHACQVGSPEECVRVAAEGLALAEASGIRIYDELLLARCVYGELLAGNIAAAREYADKLSVVPGRARLYDALYSQLDAVISLREGQFALAVEETQRAVRWAEASGWPFAEAMARVIAAMASAWHGDSARAQTEIATASAIGMRMGSPLLAYTCAFTQSSIRAAAGDSAAALCALREALSIGVDMGWANPPWFLRDEAAELYCMAAEEGLHLDYIGAVVNRTKIVPPDDFRSDRWPWPVRVYALGEFSIVIDGHTRDVRGRTQRKPLELLKAAIANGARSVDHVGLVADVWPDLDGDAGRNAFHVVVHRLRKTLGRESALSVQHGEVTLDRQCVWVDVWSFERLCAIIDGTATHPMAGQGVKLCEDLLRLYRGHFLAGGEAPWAVAARERLRNKFLRAVTALARGLERDKAWEEVTALYRRAIELEPLAEEFHRGLMMSFRAQERVAEAIDAYRRCRHLFSVMLSVEPSAATQSVYRSLKQLQVGQA